MSIRLGPRLWHGDLRMQAGSAVRQLQLLPLRLMFLSWPCRMLAWVCACAGSCNSGEVNSPWRFWHCLSSIPCVVPVHGALLCRHKKYLFQYVGCMRTDKATCLPEGSPFYAVSTHGLDPMVQRLRMEAELMSMEPPANVTPSSPRCAKHIQQRSSAGRIDRCMHPPAAAAAVLHSLLPALRMLSMVMLSQVHAITPVQAAVGQTCGPAIHKFITPRCVRRAGTPTAAAATTAANAAGLTLSGKWPSTTCMTG